MNEYCDIDTICFDYYGTLVEVGKPFIRIKSWLEEFLTSTGNQLKINEFHMAFKRQQAKMTYQKEFLTGTELLKRSYENTCEKYHLKPEMKLFENFIQSLFITPCAKEGAKEAVESLKRKYKVGLLTNADNGILKESLKRQGFTFDFVITSEDARYNKPDPKIFEYAMNLLKRSPDKIVMVGDSLVDDILSADANGMHTIWLNPEMRMGGYSGLQISNIVEILEIL